jgi:putative solute:sodium symporter small subunit
MSRILSSASKLVFVLLAVSACVGFFVGKLEAKDFMVLAGMAFAFYFSNKGETNAPYAGK